MDEQFGLLMKGLKERRQINCSLVVLVADHRETFDPLKRISHGGTLDKAHLE